ncbi:MAG: hypothetical protein AAF222_03650 [Pseudomonadota bacterium]
MSVAQNLQKGHGTNRPAYVRSNVMVLHVIPNELNRPLETFDVFRETLSSNGVGIEAMRFLDKVQQFEVRGLLKTLQSTTQTSVFQHGQIVLGRRGLGQPEHAVHHVAGPFLDNAAKVAA